MKRSELHQLIKEEIERHYILPLIESILANINDIKDPHLKKIMKIEDWATRTSERKKRIELMRRERGI